MAVKEEEKEALVPSLCVFKNGTFLNSIFLSDPEWEEENNGAKHEKILKMGRHPDCDIVVDHPSISRWHLQIQLQKSSQELLLTDLSSVHGTFVCGQRAIPKVPITLRLNDTFRLGASTRVYKFQWLPYPLEEEEDCLTPKFLHSVYEPNKHECASNGENKERDLANEGCGYTGAAGSNSWNMRCGYSDANKEQAVESTICRKLIPTLSRIVSEPHEMKYGFNNENEEQVSMEERHANAVESISRNLAPTLSDIAAEHNKQECGHNVESKELASKQKGYFRAVESIGLSNLMETPIFLENFSEPNKQKSTIFGKNKEQALKEHKHVEAVESVPNNTIKTPIYLESVSECNKGEGSFASENKDQVLKGRGNVGAVELRIPHILESVSDANKQERAFDGENKEQVLKEHGHAEVIEPVQSNPVKIPIFMESVSEPNKQECTFFDENKGETLKEHEHVETVESVPNNTIKTPIYLESVSEHNKGEGSFASENKEEALKEHGHAEAIEPVPINPVKIPIFMESVSEWKKQVFAFAAENKEQVLKEHGHVEAVESVLSNMVKTLNSLESVSQCNNGKCSFAGDNKETVLKKHGNVDVVKTVPHNPVRIPIFLDSVSEPNKQECAFAGENKEHEHVEAVESVLSNTVKTPNSLESISQCNKGECSFAGDNKEQVLKEHRKVDVVEHVPHNAVRIPIFLESVSEPNKQECAFAGENKEHEHVESVLSNTVKTPNSLESISQCNKGECSFAGDNKEQVVKEHGKVDVVEPVPHNPVRIPICLQSVSEPNKQECAFTGENKEQALKEGHVEAVTFVSINPVKSPVFLESASEIIKQKCLFASESNEHALEEHKFVEAVEPNPSNPVKTPIFLESVPEPNKQECGFASENKEQFIKKHRYFGADTLVPSNLPPILSDAVLEPNKQESGFDKENMEQTSMEEGDVKVVESDARNLTQIMLDGVSEPNKQNCDIVDKNKEQFLLEEKYVELVESVPWKPVQPSAPPLPESHSHLDCFTVVTDAEMTKVHQNQILARENNVGASNLWSRRQKDGNLLCLQTGRIEMNLNPKKMKEKQVKMAKQKRILKENSSAEIILKENNVRCDKKSRVLGEKKRDCILQVLPPEISAHGSSSTVFNQEDDDLYPSDKENCTPKVSCQASKTTTRKICRVDQDTHLLQTDTGRAPFQSLSLNSRVNNRPLISSSLKSTNRSMDNHQGLHSEVQMPGRVQHPNLADSKKKWHMVVDTGCLIHNESRQALKQLEGIKGTHLIIPRIVIRELDCLKRQNKSKKGKEAQEFLRWIEECMINKGWWVHVQNSTECFSVGVTPPASPHSNLSAGSNDASTSVAFSSYGSFADVLSPTAEDHILECALLYKRLANGGRVVLLSNDVALKVKAMAEGMLCENAKEFCQSLVSPYSERFLWSQSTAHGHNWTDINNSSSRKPLGMTRKSTYFGMMRNSLLRDEEPKKKSNEGAKGLKLILLHNSHYGQKHT